MAMAAVDDCLIMVFGRLQSAMQSFMFLDMPARVETFGLLSFACCLLASLSQFPLAVNLGVALLAVMASRSKSEGQLLALCGFAMFTVMTDLLFMAAHASAWSGLLMLVNIAIKLACASSAYRLAGILNELGGDDKLPAAAEGGTASFPAAGYQAPLGTEDYAALAAEAAGEHVCTVAHHSVHSLTAGALIASHR